MRSVRVERPVYLFGAVVADPSQCDDFRDELLRLKSSERKLHWRNLDRGHRDRVIDVISQFDVHATIVVGTPLDVRKQERARALCLERLAWEVQRLGVAQLLLEARTASLMARDRRTITSLVGRRVLGDGIRIGHANPSNEPMLWIADQILGAYGEHLAGRSHWFEALSTFVDLSRIDL